VTIDPAGVYVYRYRLPWPPSVNDYYKPFTGPRGGMRMVLTKAGKVFKEEVAVAVNNQGGRPPLPLRGPLSVELIIWRPSDRLFDPDNQLKAILDGLRAARVIADDSWRVIKTLRWMVGARDRRGGGHIEVEVTNAKTDVERVAARSGLVLDSCESCGFPVITVEDGLAAICLDCLESED